MKTDFYTRAVLTVIAVCLVYLSLRGAALLPVAHAAPETTRVLVSGWVDSGGYIHKLDTNPFLVNAK